MKKMFMAVIAMMMTISASAQFYIYFSDGSVARVDSISTVAPAPATNPGAFSVSETKKVTFSPGNLQYIRSTDTWVFASTQYEMVGTDNVTGGIEEFDGPRGIVRYGDDLADKIDLFGFSTSGTNFGVSTSKYFPDYGGSCVDWGTNQIGSDAPNTWRVLTSSEWLYLYFYRANASELMGIAQVNGVNGLIILPDDWTCPADVTFKSGYNSDESGIERYAEYQSFTLEQWSKLEAAGAVFLPAGGYRDASRVIFVQLQGYYWSSTEESMTSSEIFYFVSFEAACLNSMRNAGLSVRLVKDL